MAKDSVQRCEKALEQDHLQAAAVLAQLAIAEQLERIANAMWKILEEPKEREKQ